MPEYFQTNSEPSFNAFMKLARELYDEHKFVTWSWRIGADRSLPQNALFHVFCTEWIAFKLDRRPKSIEKFELAGMKRTVKKMYLIEHPESSTWMVQEITDYTTGMKKKDYTSSADWKQPEMYSVLTFMQNEAANQGLILESTGEFARLQREQNR